MKSESFVTDPFEVLTRFQRVVRESHGRDEALDCLTQLCHEVLNSEACALSTFDSLTKHLRFEFLAGPDLDLKRYLARQKIWIPSKYSAGKAKESKQSGKKALSNGVSQVSPHLFETIGNPFGLRISTCAIKPREQVLGFLHSFSGDPGWNEELGVKWLTAFAHQAEIIFEQYSSEPAEDDSFRFLNSLVQEALLISPADFLRRISETACRLLSTPICIVWQRDQEFEKLKIAATTGNVDEEFQLLELGYDLPAIRHFSADRKAAYALDLTRPQKHYIHIEQARVRGWCSIMSAPMWVGEKLIGLLDVYTTHPRRFEDRERDLFSAFANQAALAIQRAELLRETIELREREKHSVHDQLVSEIQKAINRVSSVSNTGPGGDLTETLNEVAEKCAGATNAKTCFIRLWDMKNPSLKLEAFHVEEKLKPKISLDSRLKLGEGISGCVAQTGESLLCDDTTEDHEYSRFYGALGIHSVVCVPIKSGDAVLGTISVGHYEKKAFHKEQQQLLENLVDSLAVSIERAHLMDCLLHLQEATMQSESLDKLLEELANFTRDLMMEPICLVWLCTSDESEFTVRAHTLNAAKENEQVPLETNEPIAENEEGYENLKIAAALQELYLERASPYAADFLGETEPLYVADASTIEPDSRGKRIKEFGWKSFLSMPLRFRRRVYGVLEVYSKQQRQFTDLQKRQFKILANQASVAIESRHRLERLTQMMQTVAECGDRDELIKIILNGALEITETERGWLGILNPKTKKLEIEIASGNPENIRSLDLGEGIPGLALKSAGPILLKDVLNGFQHLHTTAFWLGTRAILAVPIITNQTQIRVGKEVRLGEKKIGVIYLESTAMEAFSQADENAVLSLARNAAVNLEKLEFDLRLKSSRDAVKEIVSERDWDKTIQLALRKIEETLDFDYVAISMVSSEMNMIRTEYVTGIPEAQREDFKKRNSKSLSGNDIKADILRKQPPEIEVPDLDDLRLDVGAFRIFKLEQLIRVFIPMIVSSGDRAIGVVEAGYARDYQSDIYERDVQILKGYVDNLALSLEQKKRNMLPKIIHEFTAPIVAIRNSASFLDHHLEELPPDLIQQKLADMQTDCGLLFLRVGQLEHILGGKPPAQTSALTMVYRDIVMKTVAQIIPLVEERHFDPAKINYHPEHSNRIRLSVNREKLSSAVHNLLMNSIKYAEDDPAEFNISIDMEETMLNYIIKLQDWGIGIKQKYSQKIFEDGFRTPEASSRNVTGSGLGLTIALKIMQDAGGDLRLVNNRKPTEFHLILPKAGREAAK